MNYAEAQVCLQSLEAGDTLAVECDFLQPRILPILEDITWLVRAGMISLKSGSLIKGEFEVQTIFDSRCFLARIGCNLKTLKVVRQKISAREFPNSYTAALGITCGGIDVAIFPQIEGKSYGCYVLNSDIASVLSKQFKQCEMAPGGDAKRLFNQHAVRPWFFRIPKIFILTAKRILWGRVSWVPECKSSLKSTEATLDILSRQCVAA